MILQTLWNTKIYSKFISFRIIKVFWIFKKKIFIDILKYLKKIIINMYIINVIIVVSKIMKSLSLFVKNIIINKKYKYIQ